VSTVCVHLDTCRAFLCCWPAQWLCRMRWSRSAPKRVSGRWRMWTGEHSVKHMFCAAVRRRYSSARSSVCLLTGVSLQACTTKLCTVVLHICLLSQPDSVCPTAARLSVRSSVCPIAPCLSVRMSVCPTTSRLSVRLSECSGRGGRRSRSRSRDRRPERSRSRCARTAHSFAMFAKTLD
jgi:hypothetical protein